ncbi:uncharacterized protein LOC128483538 [Spea bombifrons]|uniref:uncharacterized protein LOC128483538 n=1 Tax=Spea bombifrons TaxID=233779 RepID=UPI00234BFA9B|nr:uncharacterized protein LOC128483538 [Spea bombifrons]
MRFNIEKCKVMHYGKNNKNATYSLNGISLGETTNEKDLGITVDNRLDNSAQCQQAAARANKVLACIKRGIDSREEDIILPLYRSLVRPHLEYAVQFWAPVLKKDIMELEKVQRRATKLIRGLGDTSYEERLKKLKLYTLEKRRLRGDMITLYKYMQGQYKELFSDLFINRNIQRTRGHPLRLEERRFHRRQRKGFFTVRTIKVWNSLPREVVLSNTLDTFKRGLDIFLERHDIQGYK